MIKILEFTDSLNDGGAETLIKDYALLIDQTKFQVKVVTIYDFTDTANYRVLSENGVQIIPVFKKWNNKSRILNKFFNRLYIATEFYNIIQREKPDCIHIHMALLHYFEPIRKKIEGIRMFYTCHSLPQRYFDGKNKKEFYSAQKLISDNNLQMIALHSEMAKEINLLFGITNTMVIHNGVDYERFENHSITKDEMKYELGLEINTFVVGHVGRLADVKNHDFIVQVFEKICSKKKNAHLILVGSGPLKNELISKLKGLNLENKVTFLEHRSDIHRVMKAFDVFIFPSKFEGLGIALIEAQVAGIRCFASDVIPKDARISSLVSFLSLESSPEFWAEYILGNLECDFERCSNYDKYNMRNEIKRLEEVYYQK